MTRRRRIAVVALSDADERDKIALFLDGIREAGHIPVLVPAEPFMTGAARLTAGGIAGMREAAPAVIRGSYRDRHGVVRSLTVPDVTVLIPMSATAAGAGSGGVAVGSAAREGAGSRSAGEIAGACGAAEGPAGAGRADAVVACVGLPGAGRAGVGVTGVGLAGAGSAGAGVAGLVAVDAVWPEALDITRRLAFEDLYRQIAEHHLPTVAGSWESLLNATFKHRTRRLLAALPQPRWEVVTATMTDAGIERARTWLGDGDLWVKPPGDTHSRGVTLVPRGEPLAPAARRAMRPTPDGTLCLIEKDAFFPYGGGRADLAVTVLDGRALHATLRTQPDPHLPTGSAHGGHATPVDPAALPATTRQLAADALAATGNRYGSVDILGGDMPVVGEVNAMPGGRSPGFRETVVGPLVTAYTAELLLSLATR